VTGPLTYRGAGVDIDAATRFLDAIGAVVRSTHGPGVAAHGSQFAGLIRPEGWEQMGSPLIAATCDGVGTKVLLARRPEDFEGLGRDLVAMNVNDLLPVGATPLLFLDYLAAGRLDPERLEAAVRGMAAACLEAHCALLGGETAEMPDALGDDQLEMAGFAVGLVDGDRLPTAALRPGDAVLALPATGLHANGFSLARRALLERGGFGLDDHVPELGRTLAEELLVPTPIYVDAVAHLLAGVEAKAMAHVTGGGLQGRGAAVVPEGLAMRIDPGSHPVPPVFDLIRACGEVDPAEMASTFNMGLGFLAVVPADQAAVAGWLHVGEIVDGEGAERVAIG